MKAFSFSVFGPLSGAVVVKHETHTAVRQTAPKGIASFLRRVTPFFMSDISTYVLLLHSNKQLLSYYGAKISVIVFSFIIIKIIFIKIQ